MFVAYNNFLKLVDETENVHVLYEHLTYIVKVPFDISDLLRWQWMQCVSALDKLVHDLVRIGMINIYEGKRVETPKYKTFQLDMDTYCDMISQPMHATYSFENKIIQKHVFLAFQDPYKISDALSYIWDESDKWGKISLKMGIPKDKCISLLKSIVIRRNQIVHEGDYTDILAKRQEIYEQDIIDIRNFILKLGESIYNCVR